MVVRKVEGRKKNRREERRKKKKDGIVRRKVKSLFLGDRFINSFSLLCVF